MSIASWSKKIRKWIREGTPDSEFFIPGMMRLEDVKGTVGQFIFSHKALSYDISMQLDENFLSIVVYSGIETAIMSKDERLTIYRKMLIANDEIKLVKLALYGRNDELTVRTDLDLATLGLEEFNDAIISVIIGKERLLQILNMDEEESDEHLKETLIVLIKEMGKDRVISMLMDKGGMSKEEAIEMVESLIKEYDLEPPSPMYG